MATAKDINTRDPFPFGEGLSEHDFKAYYIAKSMLMSEMPGTQTWGDWTPRFVRKNHMKVLKECRKAVIEASRKVGSPFFWDLPMAMDIYMSAGPVYWNDFNSNEQVQFAMIACSLLNIKMEDIEAFVILEGMGQEVQAYEV